MTATLSGHEWYNAVTEVNDKKVKLEFLVYQWWDDLSVLKRLVCYGSYKKCTSVVFMN